MLVEKSFVINLKIRPDRLEEFQDRWPDNDVIPRPEVWHAIHGDTCRPPDNWTSGNGAWGCYKAHLNILEHCLNNRISSYAVFEDDAKFADHFSSYLPQVFAALPEDWQQFYIGGQLLHETDHPPVRINDYIYKPFNVNRTHAFIVSAAGMLPIYRWISNLPFHGGEHIDHHLGRLHERGDFGVYCSGQWIVGQGGTSSNVSGKTDPVMFWEDPEKLALVHWLYTNPMCVVLRGPTWLARDLEDLFHCGNWRDSAGYDKGLSVASKYRYPGPEITRWYGCVRAEVVREGKNRVPCLFHPMISDEMIAQSSVGRVLLIENADSAAEVREKVSQFIVSKCNPEYGTKRK